jgi:hypothetical protein
MNQQHSKFFELAQARGYSDEEIAAEWRRWNLHCDMETYVAEESESDDDSELPDDVPNDVLDPFAQPPRETRELPSRRRPFRTAS